MTEVSYPRTIIKSAGPRLVPFIKTCTLFFVLFPEKLAGNIWYLLFKCAPIVCLIGFVLSHGMTTSSIYGYNRRVILGLFFSLLGDIALVFDSQFLTGIGLFGVAQFFYTSAFGMWPLRAGLGAGLAAFAACVYMCVAPYMQCIFVQTAGFVYTALIISMLWRASARVQFSNKQDFPWTAVCSLVGAVLFVCSDLMLAVNKFLLPIPHAHAAVMATYYAAQLGISLSVIDSHVDKFVQLSVAGA